VPGISKRERVRAGYFLPLVSFRDFAVGYKLSTPAGFGSNRFPRIDFRRTFRLGSVRTPHVPKPVCGKPVPPRLLIVFQKIPASGPRRIRRSSAPDFAFFESRMKFGAALALQTSESGEYNGFFKTTKKSTTPKTLTFFNPNPPLGPRVVLRNHPFFLPAARFESIPRNVGKEPSRDSRAAWSFAGRVSFDVFRLNLRNRPKILTKHFPEITNRLIKIGTSKISADSRSLVNGRLARSFELIGVRIHT
jgi:hypothetical protein